MTSGIIPSNLGKLNIPMTYGNLLIDRMVFLPSISESVPLVLGAISAGGKMVLSLTFAEPMQKSGSSPESNMIQIRNRMLEYMGFPDNVRRRLNDIVKDAFFPLFLLRNSFSMAIKHRT
jgi:hypothetical protein